MVVRMSLRATVTCLDQLPKQRRHRRRRKVGHHPSSCCFIGARRRRPPGDPSYSSARPRFEKRYSQCARACPSRAHCCAGSERTEPPPPSDGPPADLRLSVEFSQILAHVIRRHVFTVYGHVEAAGSASAPTRRMIGKILCTPSGEPKRALRRGGEEARSRGP